MVIVSMMGTTMDAAAMASAPSVLTKYVSAMPSTVVIKSTATVGRASRWLLHLHQTRKSKVSDEDYRSQLIEHGCRTEDAATAN
jgi:hypothetical protein